MFKLFNKTSNNNDKVIMERKQTMNEVIMEIHDTFYTEVDKLLVSAKNYNSLDTDKEELINKCNRLKALGFSNGS